MKINLNAIARFTVLLFVGIVVSACKPADSEESAQGSPAPLDAAEPAKLVIFNWEDYIAPNVLEKFTEEFGVEVDYQAYENTIELKARLQSSPGDFDIVIADDVSLRELAALKMVKPLERSRFSGLEHIGDRFLDLYSDPGNKYTVPYLWGTTLIAYRTDLIGDIEPSWNSFFDTSHGLNVGVLDEMGDVYAAALLANGYPLTSGDSEQLEEATELLQGFAKQSDFIVDELYTLLDALDSGEVAMTMTYSGDAAMYAEENENIDYLIPEEGAALWIDSFAIASEATHKDAAYQFIEFMLRPEVAAENAAFLWYATPNQDAIVHLDEEFTGDTAIWPTPEVRERCDFHAKASAARDLVFSKGMKFIMDEVRRKNRVSSVSDAVERLPVTGPVDDAD